MVRRTRKIKRSKNKKGGQSKFWAKATEGAGDIKTGFFTAVAKGKEVGAGAQQGMKDFNEARKAQYQSKVGATGGDGGRYSPVFEKMMKKGIRLQVHYIPVHLQPYYKKNFNFKIGNFPVAEKLCSEVLSFPHHQHLKQNEIKYISNCINEFYE